MRCKVVKNYTWFLSCQEKKTSPIWKILLKKIGSRMFNRKTSSSPDVRASPLTFRDGNLQSFTVSCFDFSSEHPDKRHGLFWQYRARWVVDWSTRTPLLFFKKNLRSLVKWELHEPTKAVGNMWIYSISFGLLYQLYLLRIIPTFFRGYLSNKV